MKTVEGRARCPQIADQPRFCERHYSPSPPISRRPRVLPLPKWSPRLLNPIDVNVTDEQLLPMILKQLENLGKRHNDCTFLDLVGLGQADEATAHKRFEEFWPWIVSGLQGTQEDTAALKGAPSMGVFRAEYLKDGITGIKNQLGQTFQAFNANYEFSDQDMLSQAAIADLRYPTEWYPQARILQRTIHLHVGPTNSGKTYHALKRLEQAESGVYAGPLRLLAHEVFSRLNAKGKACNLVTGDEQVIIQDGEKETTMSSCTVEMLALTRKVDVAIIDEIQMMAHPERGWAWTQALLGLTAKELHLCGEVRSVPIIKELVASIGDKLVIHNYERLNPLEMERTSLNGRLSLLRKGDAVVVFSKVGIHAMKKAIEKATGKRVAIVYGALPPEIRAQQARLFNDESNDYDFLVASDAIGMGLNLNIKRIIFESIRKFNGVEKTILPISEIKQIAGRAGRYKTLKDSRKSSEEDVSATLYESLTPPSTEQLPGYVTCFDSRDLPTIAQALKTNAPPITAVGIAPPEDILERFASHFPPQTPYSYVMLRMYEFARLNPRFFLCDARDQMKVADALRPVRNLTISDLMVFCASPANFLGETDKAFLQAMATCVAEQRDSDVLDLLGNELEVLDQEISPQPEYMTALETLHRNLVLYIWLSYRFGTFFRQRPLATHAKMLVEDNINKVLSQFSSVKVFDAKFRKLQKQSLLGDRLNEQVQSGGPSEPASQTPSTFDRTKLTTSSNKNAIHHVMSIYQQQSHAPSLVNVNERQFPIRKLRVHRESSFTSRAVVIDQHPELDKACGGNRSTANSIDMAQVPLMVVGLHSKEANAERLPLDEKPLAVRRFDGNKWSDNVPNHCSASNPEELIQSRKEPLVALRRSEALQSRNAMMEKTSQTAHNGSHVLKTLGSWAQDVNANHNKQAATSPDPETQPELQKESIPPNDQLASNFFTASSEQPHTSEFFTASNSLNDRGTIWKHVAMLGNERPPPKSSPHQTTIDILNSLIAKAPSFRQRTDGLRR